MNPNDATPTSELPARLAKALATVAHGLPNVFDESTDYFHGFVAALDAGTALTPDSFKGALEIGATYEIDFRPASDFFGAGRDYGEPESSGFALLEKLMNATLDELAVAFARRPGAVRVRMWLFGRFGATLVGLRSEATET